jgi:NTE family protein
MTEESAGRFESRREPVLIDLALQGGGSHGAFTWGVLDRLLEESWLTVEAISGTSAGAMNAAVMVSGYMQSGGRGRTKSFGRLLGAGCRVRTLQSDPEIDA